MGLIADYIGQLSLLDALTTNSGPPPSAGWAAGSLSTGTSQLLVSGNRMGRSAAGWGSGYWGTGFGQYEGMRLKCEVAGDFSFDICTKDEGGANWDSYECNYTASTHKFDIWVITNGATGASLANSTALTLAGGEDLAFMYINDALVFGYNNAGTWTDLVTATGVTTLTAGGHVGAWVNGTTAKFTGLYGGTLTPIATGRRGMMMDCG